MKCFNLRFSLSLVTLLLGFCDVFAQNQTVQLFAHRGSRFEFDENTLPAFKGSYDAGLRGFETDLRMTLDGEIVVTHDASLKRLTPCNKEIETMTAKEVRRVKTNQGNDMLFLPDLVKFLSARDSLYVEFEMKTNAPISSYPEDRLREYCMKLYDIIIPTKPTHSTYVFTSADERALKMMRELHPGVDMLLIINKPLCDETILEAIGMNIKRIGCRLDGTSKAAVDLAHKAGLSVSLWPNPNPESFILGYYLGADALVSDRAVSVKKFLDEKATWIKYK